MTITQFGRVEMDLSRVPIPASATESSEPSFRERLDTVSEKREPEPRLDPRQVPNKDNEIDSPETIREPSPAETSAEPAGAESAEQSDVGRAQPLPYRTDRGAGPLEEASPAERPIVSRDKTENTTAGIPFAQAGTPQSGRSTADAAAPGAQNATDLSTIARNTSTAQAQSGGPVEAKAPAEGAREPRNSISAERTQPGYRTISKATVQMAEAARDSVFRQIAMRINGEGGEMRVLLDPPEVGQLDLKMVVEKGGTVHLSMIAERPELALILEKHMAELKQTLQVQGLSIGNTEVRAQDNKADNAQNNWRPEDDPSRGSETEEDDDLSTAAFRRAGYITADGLDFWV